MPQPPGKIEAAVISFDPGDSGTVETARGALPVRVACSDPHLTGVGVALTITYPKSVVRQGDCN
ncbi:hypothetical protein [Nocardia altamirensis]|uniref:hypothetical protein n=1 Tax=Nocardia altamirensis TaxID=472158 RepID=UPI00083FE4AB|nr:hypothetical protein [Nocardia altamirensis]